MALAHPNVHDTPNKPARLTRIDDRLAAAKAALAAAETKQGLRSVITPLRLVPPAPANTPDQTTAHAQTQTSSQTQDTDSHNAPHPAPTTITRADRESLPVHPALTELLPHGLTRGAITTTNGSTHTALTLLAAHTQAGGWAAIIGHPNLNYVAAQDLGINLERLIIVDDPGDKTPEVIAALIEGVELLLLGPRVTLTHSEQRTLTARNRERGSHIISNKPWKGARAHLNTQHGPWQGTHHGLGRLATTTYHVTRTDQRGNYTANLETHNGALTTSRPQKYATTTNTHTTLAERVG